MTSLLGAGGMSIVYAAEHRNGRRVAIKLLRPEYAADRQVAARFLSEGYVANRIGHPAVVAILDDDRTARGVPFLVMELLEGESLHDRVQAGPLPPLDVLVIADRVLDALEAAHAVGVLHRDLKPENLFLTKQRELKVLDLGIARCREASGGFTMVGQAMGTPAYMPPEQARGDWSQVDERSDLFSLAATLFVLSTGVLPRQADSPGMELALAINEPLPPVRTVCPQVPEALAEIIDRGAAMDRRARFASATEMREAVHEAWVELTSSPIETLHGTHPQRSDATLEDVFEDMADDRTEPQVLPPVPATATLPLATLVQSSTLRMTQTSPPTFVDAVLSPKRTAPAKRILGTFGAIVLAGLTVLAAAIGGRKDEPAPVASPRSLAVSNAAAVTFEPANQVPSPPVTSTASASASSEPRAPRTTPPATRAPQERPSAHARTSRAH